MSLLPFSDACLSRLFVYLVLRLSEEARELGEIGFRGQGQGWGLFVESGLLENESTAPAVPQSRHTPHGGSEKPTQTKVPAFFPPSIVMPHRAPVFSLFVFWHFSKRRVV